MPRSQIHGESSVFAANRPQFLLRVNCFTFFHSHTFYPRPGSSQILPPHHEGASWGWGRSSRGWASTSPLPLLETQFTDLIPLTEGHQGHPGQPHALDKYPHLPGHPLSCLNSRRAISSGSRAIIWDEDEKGGDDYSHVMQNWEWRFGCT